jgi:hypothetical protein
MDNRQGKMLTSMACDLLADGRLVSHQEYLYTIGPCCLNRSFYNTAGGVIAPHRIDGNFHQTLRNLFNGDNLSSLIAAAAQTNMVRALGFMTLRTGNQAGKLKLIVCSAFVPPGF